MIEWIKAARLRTLPLSISGIIAGSFLAKWQLSKTGEFWDWKIFALALVVTLFYQVLSNFANDYGDGVKGTDALRVNEAEARAVASGKITAKQMKNAVIIMVVLSLIATIALLLQAFVPHNMEAFYTFIGLGMACIFAAMGYTMGKKPYGYMGLGDIMVFIFFGLVSVGGSYFLFTKTFDWHIMLPASAIGLMSAAVLNLNNMRDMESDKLSGKRTFALRLGFAKAMAYQMALLNLPLLLILIFLMLNFDPTQNYYPFMVMIMMFPLMGLRRKILVVKEPKELDPFLKQVGIMTLMISILLAYGINH